jgi:hypothetical protein
MRTIITAIALALSGAAALADGTDGVRIGAVVQVKPNSVWFEGADQLEHWQDLQRGGDAAAFAAYQDGLLRQREAWQFIDPLEVKILRRGPKAHQVNVRMLTEGRFKGSIWMLDADTLVK